MVARMTTRLDGSGTVPRVFAFAVLVIVTGFLVVWVSTHAEALLNPLVWVIEAAALGLAIRSLFVGVFFSGDAVLVRAWFRDYRYAPGELTAVTAVPYWKFLDPKDPILELLRFTPAAGWVREVAATVAWRDRAAAQARTITEHLG
jgi:hypothetical protein